MAEVAWPAAFEPGAATIRGARAESSKRVFLFHQPRSPRW